MIDTSIRANRLKDGKKFRLQTHQIKAVGKVNSDFDFGAPPPGQLTQQERFKRLDLINRAKYGDVILLKRGNSTEEVKFNTRITRGTKYVFAAQKQNGSVYRFSLDSIAEENFVK